MDQIVQVAGSLLVLVAFVAAQRGRLSTQSRLYQALNFVGASILAVLAAHEHQLGFLLLEAVWAVVAGGALLKGRRSDPSESPISSARGSRSGAPARG